MTLRLGSIGKTALISLATFTISLGAQSARIQSIGAVVSRDDWAKAAGSKQTFDVASVKENRLGGPPFGPPPKNNVDLNNGNIYVPTGGVFSAQSRTLIDYIAFAYRLTGNEVREIESQTPKWVKESRFDIVAKSADPKPTKDQLRLMMQSLLAERFKLSVHRETKQLPVLALVLVKQNKLGPRLRPHRPDDPICATTAPDGDKPTGLGWSMLAEDDSFPPNCGWITFMRADGHTGDPPAIKKGARNVTMQQIASALPQMGDPGLDPPVIDRTGLAGMFDFTLQLEFPLAPGAARAGPTGQPDTSQMFLEELNDQLGLKLVRNTGPVDVLAIDHIDHLSVN